MQTEKPKRSKPPSIKLIKPKWISHPRFGGKKRYMIYTLDFHPKIPRLATGSIDALIKIWNIEDDVVFGKREINRHVCTLEGHGGAILCCKFSPCGRYLASASDHDNMVFIWTREENPSEYTKKVFGSDEVNSEPWKCISRLSGHKIDIIDLVWSPDSGYLASADMAGEIIIWDSESQFEIVKKLEKHKGCVKGLSWDPAGKYLASQADDRCVIIWNTYDWTVTRQIYAHFEKSGSMTMFKRLKWSPCGSILCGVSAVDESGLIRTASLIKRDTWEEEVCLAGHEAPIQCCAFSPFLFENLSSPDEYSNLLALGGQEGTISFWSSSNPRSPFAIEGLFNSEIYDLSWSPDGRWLAACGKDGTVALISIFNSLPIDHNEDDVVLTALGRMLPFSQVFDELGKYGYKPNAVNGLDHDNHVYFSGKLMEIGKQVRAASKNENLMNSRMMIDEPSTSFKSPVNNLTTKPPAPMITGEKLLNIQKATKTKDGKRRLQPVLVSGSSSSQPASSDNQTKTSIFLPPKPLSLPQIPLRKVFIVEITRDKILYKFTAENFSKSLNTNTILAHPNSPVKVSFSNSSAKYSWNDFLFSTVLLCDISSDFIVCSCSDGSIIVWTLGGRRYMPQLILEDAVYQFCVRKHLLLCLTRRGTLWLIDLLQKKLLLQRVALSPILTEDDEKSFDIASISLTESLLPLVSLKDHKVFIFNPQLRSWLRIGVSDMDMNSLIQIYNGLAHDPFVEQDIDQLTSNVQEERAQKARQVVRKLSTRVNHDAMRFTVLTDLEEKISLAIIANNGHDLRRHMLSYASRLGDMDEAVLSKAQELIKLIYPSIGENHDAFYFGLPKNKLFDDIYPLLAKNRHLQSLLLEYSTTETNIEVDGIMYTK